MDLHVIPYHIRTPPPPPPSRVVQEGAGLVLALKMFHLHIVPLMAT